MKKLILLIIICPLFIFCDDKIDSLEELNSQPYSEYYTINTNQWITSMSGGKIKENVKYYNEDNKLPYSVSIRFKDKNNNFGSVTLNSEQANSSFYVNDLEYYQNFEVELDSFSFSLKNSSFTNKKFKLILKDTWNKTHILNFDLNYMYNVAPIPLINANVINNYEYELNASNSYDGDSEIGGFIRDYEYVIDNFFVINTSNKIIHHVFTPGKHNVKLRVKDNDNVWSDYIEKNIIVN